MAGAVSFQVRAPDGQTRAGAFEPAPPGAASGPPVSCLMITRGELAIARHAIACYRAQTYTARQLVVVADAPCPEFSAFLRSLGDPTIALHQAPPALTLGDLRNFAIARAEGPLVCQWDDDDLYDPFRLAWSVEALQASEAAAVFLDAWLMWWPARRRIAGSLIRPWEGSMLAFREVVPVYPAMPRGEDTVVMRGLLQHHTIALMRAPQLYLKAFTGRNAWDEAAFESLFRRSPKVLEGADYDAQLHALGRRMPVAAMAEAIGRTALASAS